MTIQVDQDWWKELFDEVYLQTDARSVCNDRLTGQEVNFLEEVLNFRKSSPILDLCGGQGRHALELTRRGFSRVTLLDYSGCLLRLGKRKAIEEGLNTVYIRADARNTGLRDQAFSVILILGSSFGYFEDETENQKILDEAFRLLSHGGELFLDLPDRDFVLEKFKPIVSHRVDNDIEVTRTRSHQGNIIYCREIVNSRTRGCIRDRTYCTRLYSPESISVRLTATGFTNVLFQKDFMCRESEGDFGTMTSRMIVKAQKPV